MALRWTATGLLEAQKTFRRLKAYRQLPILRNALQEHLRKAQADSAIETIMKATPCRLAPARAGAFLVRGQRLARLPVRRPAFEVLSCGRDRVRWPVPLVVFLLSRPAVEPAALVTTSRGRLVRAVFGWPYLGGGAPGPWVPR